MLLTVRHLFFLLFLVLGQSQLGFGENDDKEYDEENYDKNKEQSFTAVSSLFFRPGTDYTVFFTANPHWKKKPLQLKVVLMANSSRWTTMESDPISLRPGESGQISIPLPQEMPGNETVWRLFAWWFWPDSLPNEYEAFAPHTLIYSSLANTERQTRKKADLASIFIQTDKPAYKPDDLVRIRVVTMGKDDLPHLTSGVNMTITDGQGNVMKKWNQPLELPESASQPSNVSSNESVALFGEFQKKKNGLSSYEFQLSSEPILGSWTIQVEAGNIKEKMFFEVQKYIFPKFQVKIHAPSVLYGTGEILAAATIQVSYTSGKDLEGTGNVTVTSGYDGLTKIQQIVVKNGEAMVHLTLRSTSSSTVHTITANVTEKNTGRWQIGKATVRIYPREIYSVQWINKPSSYKPGLLLTVQLKITSQDGFPVKDTRTNSLRVTFSSSLNLPEKKTSIALSGIATFTFPTLLEPIPAYSKFQVQYKSSAFYFTLPPAENATSSGILIEIVSPPDTFNLIQGHSYNFTIRSNKPIQPEVFQCLLWDEAAMEVHGAKIIMNSQREPATEFPFSLQIPKGDYKKLKIFVYFENYYDVEFTTQIISTFKSINTHNYLKIRVSRPIPMKVPDILEVNSTTEPTPAAPVEIITPDYVYDYSDDGRLDPGVSEEPQSSISDKLQVEPGAAVEIHFETYPDSTIAIRGIDQSLLLLTEHDNDLNQEAVERKRAYFPYPHFELDNIPTENTAEKTKYCSGDSSCSLKAFHRLGISVLSSDRMEPFGPLSIGVIASWEESEILPSENELLDALTIPQVDSRLPIKFPETWLWEEFESKGNSSTTILNKFLPDTLTSWIISGFSLNPKTGLGIASPATITGFMPFFVTLNLPYSVVKDESFDLQVIVHNHLARDVNVFVALFNRHNDFDFEGSRNGTQGNKTQAIKVQKNHAALAHFVITPMVFWDIPIEVRAVTEDGDAGDSILRFLKVKPDGVRETRSQTVTFESKTGAKNLNRTASFDVEFPKNVVKGASSLQLTVVGDPMGTILSNLGHHLQVPFGCGEQNMIRLVPNILALHYITATDSKANYVMKQAKRNMEIGYGNQLQYRKADGSFSVFTSTNGTTWLTAYVLQWFVVAQQYITIDPHVIRGAINFIRASQQLDGSFVEKGLFYHPEMRGHNRTERVALTAFITLALIKANETSNNDLNLKVAIENGMRFISQESVYQQDDNYVTNLVTATLMAVNHPEGPRFFEKMEKGAKTTVNAQKIIVKYWDMIRERERASGPLAIEMTSYALLAHLWRTPTMDISALKINNWLLSQRNSQGGFISTQDTMMGLTALSEFALRAKTRFVDDDELQLNIRASSSSSSNSNVNSNDTELVVPVVRWSRMVLQEFDLPVDIKKVSVQARGSGRALVQMTETWYMPIRNTYLRYTRDHFNITAKMTIPDPKEPTETELRVCVNSYRTSGSRDSIASIQLPSGYIFYPEDYEADSEFMAQKPRNVQKFELSEGNTKMDVYFSKIKGHPQTCLSLAASQQFEVANAKNPVIHVYEYLNPALKARIVYEPAHNITLCQLCRHTRACDDQECD